MGADSKTYVGIYIEIPHSQKSKTITNFKHPQTGKTVKYKFCPNTGLEMLTNTFVETNWEEPNIYDLDDTHELLNEDEFFQPAYMENKKQFSTFILNSTGKYSKTLDEIETIDLSNVNIPELISQFKTDYVIYLDAFTKEFGGVNVYYGIVNYAH